MCGGGSITYETLSYHHNSGGSRISRRGGVDLVGGGVDSRGGYISKILYVKMKELGPLGGRTPGVSPPRSTNAQGAGTQFQTAWVYVGRRL